MNRDGFPSFISTSQNFPVRTAPGNARPQKLPVTYLDGLPRREPGGLEFARPEKSENWNGAYRYGRRTQACAENLPTLNDTLLLKRRAGGLQAFCLIGI